MRKKIVLILGLISLALLTAFIFDLTAGESIGGRSFDYVAEPRLIYPISDMVDLTAKEFLEFKWDFSEPTNTRYLDFRLYKGYDMHEKNLILKQRQANNTYSFKVDASTFEDGQVYTWSLMRASLAGFKSDVNFNSFKIVKKGPAPNSKSK